MTWWYYVAKGVLAAGTTAVQMYGQRRMYKYMKKTQEYNNKMINIQNAMNQGRLSYQDSLLNEKSAALALQIDMNEAAGVGSATVQAAAAGVKGKSVDVGIRAIKGSADRAEQRRRDELRNSRISLDFESQGYNLQAALRQDRSYIPNITHEQIMFQANLSAANELFGNSGGGGGTSGQGLGNMLGNFGGSGGAGGGSAGGGGGGGGGGGAG